MCELGVCRRRGASLVKLEDGQTVLACPLHALMLGEAGAYVPQLRYELLDRASIGREQDECYEWLSSIEVQA